MAIEWSEITTRAKNYALLQCGQELKNLGHKPASILQVSEEIYVHMISKLQRRTLQGTKRALGSTPMA